MSTPNPYAEFTDDQAPAEETFAKLNELVDKAKAKEIEILTLAASLAKAQEELREITWRQLPQQMDDMGLKDFTTKKGLKIEIKEVIEAGISEEHRPAAHKWLEDNNHGGLIKREISVAFNRTQQEQATKLVTDLKGQGYAGVAEKKNVHPSTLKAWVKEMLAKGAAVPEDTFGIFRRREAKFHAIK